MNPIRPAPDHCRRPTLFRGTLHCVRFFIAMSCNFRMMTAVLFYECSHSMIKSDSAVLGKTKTECGE